MQPGKPRPLLDRRTVEITYVCERCGATTNRTVKEAKP
jgi:hypothetical protein